MPGTSSRRSSSSNRLSNRTKRRLSSIKRKIHARKIQRTHRRRAENRHRKSFFPASELSPQKIAEIRRKQREAAISNQVKILLERGDYEGASKLAMQNARPRHGTRAQELVSRFPSV